MRIEELQRDATERNKSLSFPRYLLKLGEGLVPNFLGALILPLPISANLISSIRSIFMRLFERIEEKNMNYNFI